MTRTSASIGQNLRRDPQATSIGFDMSLPRFLWPLDMRGATRLQTEKNESALSLSERLPTRIGTPASIVEACRKTILHAARDNGVIRVDAESYGRYGRLKSGGYAAPVYSRVVYWRKGGYEFRAAPIWCMTDQAGKVTEIRPKGS